MEQDGEHTDLPHVNLVFIGPCSSGKSTMVGHLIADSGAIDAENLQRIFDEADRRGQPDRRYAWILDKLSFERKRGHSMSVALWRLASRRCRFTVMDAPGHKDFSKDIVTAMSQADIAVLVVSTSKSDLEQGEEGEIQLREHTLLAYTLGLRRLVVCVNKMDSDSARFSEDRFATACRVVRERLKTAGLKTNDVFFDVHFVPTSGWCGDNVISRSDNMPWFGGPTLIEALDEAVASHFRPERPLRFPLAEVMKVGGKGTVVVGRVATGSLRCGAKLTFAPGGAEAEVTAIAMHHEPLNEAVVGNTVTVTVDAEMSELRRGMVGSAVDESPACECSSFLAQVIVLSDPRAGEIRDGSELTVVCHTAQVLCAFQELVSRSDRRTGKVLQMRPLALRGGDAALVRLRPRTPLCVEPFEEYPALGRFSVHDQKVTVAVGVVQKVEQGPPSAPRRPSPTSPSGSQPATHTGERRNRHGLPPKPMETMKAPLSRRLHAARSRWPQSRDHARGAPWTLRRSLWRCAGDTGCETSPKTPARSNGSATTLLIPERFS
ncbi:Elongation factor 1-alpha [Symbiodinium microadriaticum]|uniref:Elongation factor 1-alpha n=1 Tax=Symbiodinium microadriaticum TaxID=2951 RepID=A0A1Q9EE12_SYMMI|nr:Elongation factor 1-alpha [Symbiodinium microadriaticum]